MQRHQFSDKCPYSQTYGFSSSHVWMLELDHKEDWAQNWCFVSNCGAGVPWTARRSNHSILKKINPAYSLEGLMLKLKFQSFGHLMQRANSLEKTLILGKIESRKRRGQQRIRRWHHQLNGHEFKQTLRDGEGQGSLACFSPWGGKESDVTQWLSNNP